LVVTDLDDRQQETTESNNIAVLQVELVAPDLQITSVSAPLNLALGDSVEVSWTVTNLGTGTGNQQWTDAVYLSEDEDLDLSDRQLIIHTRQQAPLAIDGNYTQTNTINLELDLIPDLIPGDYHLLFITDSNNQQIETTENNNLLAVDFTVQPPDHADLILEAITVPSESLSGEEIEIIWRVRNQGTHATNSANWLDSIYLSSDQLLDSDDTQLGLISHTGAIAPDRTYTNTARVELPDGISGDYYILVKADEEDGVYEYLFENNNLGISSQTIAVTRKPDPDLEITSLTVPETVQAGETYTISWEVTNHGDAIVEDDWQDKIYLTNNGAIDNDSITLATEFQVAPLAVGGKLNPTATIEIPLLDNGDYQIVIVTDASSQVFEGDNEHNNQENFTITVANPDLEPTILIAPETATSGSSVSLDWLVKNTGIGPAQGGWTESVYLSNDERLDEKDILLKEFTRAGSLDPNSNYPIGKDITIPISARGSQYLIVATDTGNILAEVNGENNNTTAVPIEIRLTDFADLAVSEVTAPSLTIGDPGRATITWKVSNVGQGITNVDSWVDQVVASQDEVIGNHDDIILASFTQSGALNSEASYSSREEIILPPALSGRYQLFVQTDSEEAVFEDGLTNNNTDFAPNVFDVTRQPYADLAISSITTEQNAASGRSLEVSWTATNQGIGITNQNLWDDQIKLATDPQGQDIIATLTARGTSRFEHVGPLGVDQSYSRTVFVDLPNGLNGTYYVVVSTGNPSDNLLAGGSIDEFIYTHNNSAVSQAVPITFTPPPDLEVIDIVAPDLSVESGQRVDLSWTVRNNGPGEAIGSWTDRVYLQPAGNSADSDENLISLGSFTYSNSLGAGNFYQRREQFYLPSNLQGLYQVVVETNANQSLYEARATDNNQTVDDNTIELTLPPRPDLQIRSITVPPEVQAGGTVSVEFEIINQGTVPTTTPHWTDRVYLSLDNQISGDDILLGSLENQAALQPGGSYKSKTEPLVVPRRFRGPVHIIVQTDSDQRVDERDREVNNTDSKELTVIGIPPSDLVVSDVVAPTQTFAGATVELSYKVTNLGVGETDRDGWTDTIWLTRDKDRPSPRAINKPPSVINDIYLTAVSHQGSLDKDGYYEVTTTVTIPENIKEEQIVGDWYLTPWTDAYDLVLEDTFDVNLNPDDPNELDNNNYKARKITILSPPPKSLPDLAVTNIVSPLEGVAGEPFQVSWTVENQGDGATTANWSDIVYLCRPTHP